MKVLPHLVEIVDVGCERDFLGQHLIRGSPTSPLVVVDEAECIRQSIQVGQEIAMVEIRPAVEDDDGLPLPDFSRIERRLPDRNTAFARCRGPLGLKRPRRIRRQRRHERCCEAGDDETSPHEHTLPLHPCQRNRGLERRRPASPVFDHSERPTRRFARRPRKRRNAQESVAGIFSKLSEAMPSGGTNLR